MEVIILIGIFILSLVALVKGADFLLSGAERIGMYFKLPAFVIGALIVGIGTSLPELASSISAVLADTGEIVVANAVGSNIANILLVAGLSAVVGRAVAKNGKSKVTGNKIVSTKNLLNLEAPLLVISTVLFLGVAFDGIINRGEAVLITAAFLVYLGYLLFHEDDEEEGINNIQKNETVKELYPRDYFMLVGGSALLGLGANYLIESVVQLSQIWQINPALISASAIAVGTSLPEILVSVGAVMRGRMDVAFGNVFGSNVFNMLMLVGTIGIFSSLPVDPDTLSIGLPFLAITTFIFFVSVTSRKIYVWEGLMFLIFYAFFILKLFGLA
jgi:cation:H+ antiporter